jgi:AraC family transcriptional regulator, regulatory protein of adaptative response / methylated-DNA-[protein]-cysteine methyltransferase
MSNAREFVDAAAGRDHDRIADAIGRLAAAVERGAAPPSLAELAAQTRVSPFHLQRLFTRWVGVSPKRFAQLLTLERARAALRSGETVLSASWAAGLSGGGRLHDLFVTLESVTPGEYRRGGAALAITRGVGPTPFGPALVASTPRGICALHFLEDGGDAEPERRLLAEWPAALHARDDAHAARTLERIFAPAAGAAASDAPPLRVLVRGTDFQTRVWRALLDIPPGATSTYERIARAAGRPGAARAAGQAIGRNAIAWLIPCHRVIAATGGLGGYRWGPARKRAMLAWEAARQEATVG